jgi:hypothetical protein
LHELSKVFGAMFGGLSGLPTAGAGEAALVVATVMVLAPSYSYRLAATMRPNVWTASVAAVFLTLAVLRFSSVSYFLYYFF